MGLASSIFLSHSDSAPKLPDGHPGDGDLSESRERRGDAPAVALTEEYLQHRAGQRDLETKSNEKSPRNEVSSVEGPQQTPGGFPTPRSGFFTLADTLMSSATEREGFLLFVGGGIWKEFMNAAVLEAMTKSSLDLDFGSHGGQQPRHHPRHAHIASFPATARHIYEQELNTDSIMNMDTARIEDAFTSKELRSLTIAVLIMVYHEYRCSDADLQPGWRGGRGIGGGAGGVQSVSYYKLDNSHSSTAPFTAPFSPMSISQSVSQNTAPYAPSYLAEDASFFIDPLSVVQVTTKATSQHEFIESLAEGYWVAEFFTICNAVQLSLSIASVVEQDLAVSYPLVYRNTCFLSAYEEEAPVFLPSVWERSEDLFTSWAQGLPTKSKLSRINGQQPDTQLACCLPVLDGMDGTLKYVVTIHQEIATSSAHQALLRLADFILFTCGIMLK